MALCELSLAAANGGFLLCRLLLLQRLQGTRAQQLGRAGSQLWSTGLAALCHVEPSWTRDQTLVPCTGRQVFIY